MRNISGTLTEGVPRPGSSVVESQERQHTSNGCDSLNLYMREVGKTKLLTLEEEVELARRIREGDETARDEMILANLRLVVKMARDYEGLGVPLLDLINEGNIGLMRAVERYDPAKGAKLATYGTLWIKQAIKRALANQSKTIRLPVHIVDKLYKMHQCARQLTEAYGREPSDEELAKELGTTSRRVGEMRAANTRPLSLDATLGEDEGSTLGEIVEDESAGTATEIVANQNTVQLLRELVAKLSAREAALLNARFGLDGSPPKRLEEVGALLGITRERVRQIQNKAFTKLRRMMEKRSMDQPNTFELLAA
ncbi:MAG: rpoD [Verrucomicrobiales bacterium]|nr:rpoD [Verrucomicrobiales bacterium]